MKPTICKCCGEPFLNPSGSDHPVSNICRSCESLVADEQDNMIIETATPMDLQSELTDEDTEAKEATAPEEESGIQLKVDPPTET